MNLIRFDASIHVKFYNKILQNFEKMTSPEKSFPPSMSKSLHIHLNHLQNVSLI